MGLPEHVAAQFSAHAGCAAVEQLTKLSGVTHDVIAGWRRRGITRRVHWGVDRLNGAPRTDEQKLWAALLRCGSHAIAGPRPSCWLYGLEGFRRLDVDVVLPAPHRCRGTSFKALTRVVEARDRTRVRGFPTLTRARAIIEIAHTLPPKALRVLIDSARRQGMTIELLRERAVALQAEPGCRRGARAVLDVIGTGDLGKESENEREIDEFLATTTLNLEWQVDDLVPGRRLDAVDREARLILEIDSALWHTLGSDRDADGLRELEIGEAAVGYQVFRLTLGMVRFSPDETRRRLDAIRTSRVSG